MKKVLYGFLLKLRNMVRYVTLLGDLQWVRTYNEEPRAACTQKDIDRRLCLGTECSNDWGGAEIRRLCPRGGYQNNSFRG